MFCRLMFTLVDAEAESRAFQTNFALFTGNKRCLQGFYITEVLKVFVSCDVYT